MRESRVRFPTEILIKKLNIWKVIVFFFSENGLTSTSANHVANLAKEYVQNIEKDLSNTSFINTSVTLIDSNNNVTTSIGKDAAFLELVETKLNKISDAKSLIAWLREALKAKENLQAELNRNISC